MRRESVFVCAKTRRSCNYSNNLKTTLPSLPRQPLSIPGVDLRNPNPPTQSLIPFPVGMGAYVCMGRAVLLVHRNDHNRSETRNALSDRPFLQKPAQYPGYLQPEYLIPAHHPRHPDPSSRRLTLSCCCVQQPLPTPYMPFKDANQSQRIEEKKSSRGRGERVVVVVSEVYRRVASP